MVITQLTDAFSSTPPEDLRAAKANENLHYLTIRTGNIACFARFYPALYQLTLVKHGVEEKVDLGFSGSRLLERLIRNPGEVVDRDELMSHAWSGRVVGQGSLNQQIYTLRQILCDESTREIIQTLPRRGYLINPTYVDLPAADPQADAPASPDENPSMTNLSAIAAHAPLTKGVTFLKKRWVLPAVVGLSGLSVISATTVNYSSKTQSASANLLTLTYAPAHPRELTRLVEYGELIRQRLDSTLAAPLQLVVGLHDNTVDVVCLHSDGSARSLHFPEQQADITVNDLAPCLP